MIRTNNILSLLLILNLYVYPQGPSVVINKSCNLQNTEPPIVATDIGLLYSSVKYQCDHDWTNGDLVLYNGEVIKNKILRYNGFLDEIIWLRKSDYRCGLVVKETIKEFSLYPVNQKRRHFKKYFLYNIVEGRREKFVEILVEGDFEFFSYRRITILSTSDTYYPKYEYYMLHDGTITRVYLNRKSLFHLFNNNEEKKQKVKKIVRSNHLKVRKEEGMLKFFEILNKESI
jgi:hypothetical protein